MTKVNVQPEGQTNGDQMIQFLETVMNKPMTWTFEEQQNHFFAQNNGNDDMEVKVGDQTRTINPGESWGTEIDYTSFTIRALTDDDELGVSYKIAATVYGLPGMDRVKGLQDQVTKKK